MHSYYYLVLIFIVCNQAQAQQQSDRFLPTSVATLFTSSNTSLATSTALATINNTTATGNATTTTTLSPSPTSFVFTHYPFPTHAGSSSSMMSSARPSQSAPLPDDTIGKNGRLRVSGASLKAFSSPTALYLATLFMCYYFSI